MSKDSRSENDTPIPISTTEIQGKKISYCLTGASAREEADCLVFLHGMPTSSFMWRYMQRAFISDYQTLAPDLMGFGESEMPSGETALGLEAQVEMLNLLLEKLNIEKFVLIGHEIGGGIAILYALRYPEKVKALILADTVALKEHWPVQPARTLRWPQMGGMLMSLPKPFLNFFIRRKLRRALYQKDLLSTKLLQEYSRCFSSAKRLRDSLRIIHGYDPDALHQAVAELIRRRLPKLILWADDDAYLSLEGGQEFFDRFASGKFVHIARAGHFITEDQPERVTTEIRSFLIGLA